MAKTPKKRQQRSPVPDLDGVPVAARPEQHLAGPAVQGAKKAKPRTATPRKDGAPKKAKTIKAVKKRMRHAPAAALVSVPGAPGHEDRLARLAKAVQAVHAGEQVSLRTAKLLAGGVPKMAQKLVEEAAEAAIDAVRGERAGFVNESADLLYNLVVLWSAIGVTPDEIWTEMDRREALLGLAEKLPKVDDATG